MAYIYHWLYIPKISIYLTYLEYVYLSVRVPVRYVYIHTGICIYFRYVYPMMCIPKFVYTSYILKVYIPGVFKLSRYPKMYGI